MIVVFGAHAQQLCPHVHIYLHQFFFILFKILIFWVFQSSSVNAKRKLWGEPHFLHICDHTCDFIFSLNILDFSFLKKKENAPPLVKLPPFWKFGMRFNLPTERGNGGYTLCDIKLDILQQCYMQAFWSPQTWNFQMYESHHEVF